MWRNSKRTHAVKYYNQDPLYFNQEIEHIQGDMRRLIDEIKMNPEAEVPLRKIAFFIYHMGTKRIRDFDFL